MAIDHADDLSDAWNIFVNLLSYRLEQLRSRNCGTPSELRPQLGGEAILLKPVSGRTQAVNIPLVWTLTKW